MRCILIASALALSACGGGNGEDPQTAPEPAPEQVAAGSDTAPASTDPLPEVSSPLADADPLTPGTYCFYRNDENVTEGLDVTVTEEGAISGRNFGIIHQHAASYYASFTTELSNGALGDTSAVTFDTQTEVDGDSQASSAIWYLSDQGAVPDGLDITLQPAACEGLEEKVQSEGSP